MNRLKTILQFDSSKFVHLAIVATLFTLSKTSYLAIVLLIIEIVYLFKVSKNLTIYALFILAILSIRFIMFSSHEYPNEGQIVEVEDNRLLIRNKALYYLYVDDSKDYQVGMKIRYSGDLFTSDYQNLPGNFDYKTYLLSKNVKGQIAANNVDIVGLSFTIEQIPNDLSNYISEKYIADTATYLKLFILGQKDELDMNIADKTKVIGISHLFAISGMHLSLIIGFISFLLNRFYLKEKTHQLIIGGFLLVYNTVTGFATSILRASLLAIALFFNLDHAFTKTDYLSFIMIVFLMFNPYYIYNTGFVLSFLISFSIILGKSLWFDKEKIIQVLKIGLLANLVSLPIILSLNGTYGLMNIFYNVIFVYFVSFIFLPVSFIVFFLPLSEEVYLVIIDLFETMVEFSYLANYYINFKFSSEIVKLLYWLMLMVVFVNYKREKKYAIIFSSVFIFSFLADKYFGPTYIRILDVNQGDAIHLHDQSCDILIDTGSSDDYDSVINYFVNQNIKKIDYLIITHFHSDHYGEARDILEKLEVKNLIVNQDFADFSEYNYQLMNEGEQLKCGSFQLLNINEYWSESENENSLVLYGEINNDKWLFTGDIESLTEEKILEKYNLNINILKVAHHGSLTSSNQEFIDILTPEYALISVGKNNYNHPHPEVLNRFKQSNIKIMRTDIQGTITFYYYSLIDIEVIESFYLGKNKRYQIKN